MDFGALLTRSFEITWRHRALWLYGFLLALFGGAGGGLNFRLPGGTSGGAPSTPSTTPPGVPPVSGVPPINEIGRAISSIPAGVWLTVGLAIACLVLVLIIVSVIIQSVSRGALIGMVGEVETTGRTSIRDGWHYGWSRFGWRVFAIGFLIGLAVLFLALIVAGVFVAFGLGAGAAAASRSGFSAALIPVFCLVLLIVVPLALVVSFLITTLYNLATRHAVLEDHGVIDSLGAAWDLVKANWMNLFILVVIEVALGFVWGIILLVALGIFALIVMLAPAIAAYAATQLWGPAIVAAVPGFFLLLILGAALSTLWVVSYETLWTLAYGRLTAPPAETTTAVIPALP